MLMKLLKWFPEAEMRVNNTILLTGATGYLGGYLLNAFLKENYNVFAVCLNHGEKLEFISGGGVNAPKFI